MLAVARGVGAFLVSANFPTDDVPALAKLEDGVTPLLNDDKSGGGRGCFAGARTVKAPVWGRTGADRSVVATFVTSGARAPNGVLG